MIFDPRKLLQSILRVNSPTTLVALLFSTLTAYLLPLAFLRYDRTKDDLVASARRANLPFAVGTGGTAGIEGGWGKLMDSGLLIVSSEPAVASGFVAFTEPLAEERAVNKGLLWAVFEVSREGTRQRELVVTTHMHATSALIRAAQRAQLASLIHRLRSEYQPALTVVCGDMNESAERPELQKQGFNGVSAFGSSEDKPLVGGGLHADLTSAPASLQKVSDSGPEGTCVKDDGSGDVDELDHIYAGADTAAGLRLAEWRARPPFRHPKSDHSLIVVDCIGVAP